MRIFKDRRDAGAQLARSLARYSGAGDALVLSHTRSSVPVAYEIATRLALPLGLHDDGEPRRRQCVLLVDDGDAARHMPFAIEQLRSAGAASIIVAIGVASPQVYALLRVAADQMVCAITPQHLFSVGAWYADLHEPSDEDIEDLLVAAARSLLTSRSNFLTRLVDT